MLQPQHQRTIPITSTALVLKAFEPTRVNVCQAAVDSTHFDLDTSASAVDDTYNGLSWYFRTGTGVGQNGYVDDYTGATKRVAVASALVTQPGVTTTFVLGPALPSAFASMMIGGTSGGFRYSFRSGGTGGTDYVEIGGGQFKVFETWQFPQIKLLEVKSVAASDNLSIEWI